MIPSIESAFHFTQGNRSLYLPFLISPQYLPDWLQPYYNQWLYLELAGHLLTFFSIILFVIVVWKSNAFHINMIILNTYAVMVLGGINMLTRIALIQIELKTVKIEDIADFIVPVHLIKFSAWLGIYHYVVYTTAERYAALRFAADYENKKRPWVSVGLILINTAVSVPIALLLIYDFINGAIYSALVCFVSSISCWIFWRIKKRSLANERRLLKFTNVQQYSVSHRWLVRENIRLAKDIRFFVFGCAAQIMFYLPLFFGPHLLFGHDPSWRQFLELSKACFQLLCAYGFCFAYVFCTFSIGGHVDFIRSKLGMSTNKNRTLIWRQTKHRGIFLEPQWMVDMREGRVWILDMGENNMKPSERLHPIRENNPTNLIE